MACGYGRNHGRIQKNNIPHWQGKTTLKDKRLAWIRAYGFEAYLDESTHWVEYSSAESMARMLYKDRVDVVLDFSEFIDSIKKIKGYALYEYGLEPIFFKQRYLAFSMTGRSERFVYLFDKGMKKLHQSGELDRIYQRYGYDKFPMHPQ